MSIFHGGVDFGETHSRVRSLYWSAYQSEFFLEDVNFDGAQDLGIRKTYLKYYSGSQGNTYRLLKSKIKWNIFVKDKWKPSQYYLETYSKKLPWIEITKGPVDFIRDLESEKIEEVVNN